MLLLGCRNQQLKHSCNLLKPGALEQIVLLRCIEGEGWLRNYARSLGLESSDPLSHVNSAVKVVIDDLD